MEEQNAAREEENESDEVHCKISNNSLQNYKLLFILTLDFLSTGPFGVNHIA